MDNRLTILYASCLCSKSTELKLLDIDPKCVGLQIQKYHRLLAKGFCRNNVNVEALSYQKGIEQLGIIDETVEVEDGIRYIYLTNKSGNYKKLLWNSFSYAYRFLKNNSTAVVLCDVLNFTVSLGAAIAARILHRKVIGIITDFPEQVSGKNDSHSKLIWKLVNLCTDYVVLTEQMKERLNHKKTAIVLEGHVDSDMELVVNTLAGKYEKKVCIYAGMLHRKYGIEKLVKAFIAADVKNAELHIYGDGDYAEELKALNHDSVLYLGIVPNDIVINEELKATLLINPRPTNEEFTKYSFPSKNLEYMVSGTPLLTTKLPGMPVEYYNFVYCFDDETIEGMTSKLKNILNKDVVELHEKGKEARTFVFINKTEISQAKKIIDIIKL